MLTADLERPIHAFENKCYMRMLGILYRGHKTNKYVWQQVNILARRQELLLSTVASYHGSAMSVVMIRCRRSDYKEQWKHSRYQVVDRAVDVVITVHRG